MPYYLFDGKQAVGPFEPADLAKRPGFDAATLVFPHGATTQDAWKAAGSFPDIAQALSARAAPIPPPPPAVPPPPVAPAPAFGITLELPPQRAPEPAPVAAAAPPVATSPAPVPAAAKPTPPELAAPSEKLVLVVDDDENVRSFIEMSATMEGFQVVTAVNGLDATAKLAQRDADLIITDLMMPGQGGYEFLRSLQGSGSGRIPIFVVTGSALDTSTVAMIRQEANVVEFVSKPINIVKFIGNLHKYLKTTPSSPRGGEKRGTAW
ncbi:MAG: response regulator [Elusimicrobia bacterium]|nr:response regulator [Elusimicrobiota bacterium]